MEETKILIDNHSQLAYSVSHGGHARKSLFDFVAGALLFILIARFNFVQKGSLWIFGS